MNIQDHHCPSAADPGAFGIFDDKKHRYADRVDQNCRLHGKHHARNYAEYADGNGKLALCEPQSKQAHKDLQMRIQIHNSAFQFAEPADNRVKPHLKACLIMQADCQKHHKRHGDEHNNGGYQICLAAFAFFQNGTPVILSVFVVIAKKVKRGQFGIKRAYQIQRFFALDIALQIYVKIIAEIAVCHGAGFKFCQVQPRHGKSAEHSVKRAGCVRQRKDERDLIRVILYDQFLGNNDKSGSVITYILYSCF